LKTSEDVKKYGQYIPRNPKKYVGKYPLITRSTWERSFFQWCDANESVIEWSSESVVIPYFDPVRNSKHRYYPDIYMMVKTRDGIKRYIVEIKPYKETRPPKSKHNKKTQLFEEKRYVTNSAKWDAARRWCDKMGMEFLILTEKELFNK